MVFQASSELEGDKLIKLEKLNQREALRYLGYKGSLPDDNIQKIIDECEAELL